MYGNCALRPLGWSDSAYRQRARSITAELKNRWNWRGLRGKRHDLPPPQSIKGLTITLTMPNWSMYATCVQLDSKKTKQQSTLCEELKHTRRNKQVKSNAFNFLFKGYKYCITVQHCATFSASPNQPLKQH